MLNDIHAVVAAEFAAVNDFIVDQLHSNVSLVENIGQYIVDAGGKRLRPVLVLLSARACGSDTEDAIAMAAIIEFIHTATLLHDDVVDMSTMRRGRPTANSQWNNPSSVLVGDFIYSRAFQIMVKLGNSEIMRIIADTTNIIAEGEVRQLLNKHRANTTESEYMQVIHDKTAILFQAAAHCGALLAGASLTQREALQQAGLHLGLAFQLVDDALDYAGDSETLGKNVGDDLAEGKPTLPLIHAMANSDKASAQMIRDAISGGGSEHLSEIINIVRESGALEYTYQQAMQQTEQARQLLQTLPPSRYREALEKMVTLAIQRSN